MGTHTVSFKFLQNTLFDNEIAAPIALAVVAEEVWPIHAHLRPGERDERVDAVVVGLPFYKRA